MDLNELTRFSEEGKHNIYFKISKINQGALVDVLILAGQFPKGRDISFKIEERLTLQDLSDPHFRSFQSSSPALF